MNSMSTEMHLAIGIALGFVCAGLELAGILCWDRIRSFFKKNPN